MVIHHSCGLPQVEFFFPGKDSLVEYRSASRIGESDGDINRCFCTSVVLQ